jgi:hypothetical protein
MPTQMLEYCKLDTRAMVEILRAVRAEAQGA